MTETRDFDRLIRAWLDLMPSEAPDRVVSDVLLAAETSPQVRRPIRWLPWRSTTMTPLRMGAAIAAVLVVAITGAYLVTRVPTTGTGGPTATPVVTPSVPPASPEGVPTSLVGNWMGGHKTGLPGLASSSGTVLTFTEHALALAQANQVTNALLAADAGASDESRFVVSGERPCTPNGPGLYAWQLSADERHLTVSLVSDECSARSLVIPGDYVKTLCKIPADLCLGDLAVGTYSSQYIDPRVKAADTWAPNFGAITYTVPDAWANSADWPSELYLTPSANYAVETADGPPAGAWYSIGVLTQPAVNDPDVDCFTGLTTVPRTVDAFIAHLVASPAITSTAPEDVTIDGHAGKSIEIAKDPAWTGTCGVDAGGAANVLIDTGLESRWIFGPTDGERVRLILLDIGSGDLVLILLDAGDGSKLDQLVTQAMPIVESFHFE